MQVASYMELGIKIDPNLFFASEALDCWWSKAPRQWKANRPLVTASRRKKSGSYQHYKVDGFVSSFPAG